MEIRYYKHWSGHLNRDMEFKIYGPRGLPVLFIPCQAGRFWDFEDFHMIDTWAKWIEVGRVTVFSMDTIDSETWAARGGDCRQRIERHEQWFRYVTDELVPTIRHLSGERNWRDIPIMLFGCSMGAMHAGNLFFRRPDLFGSILALSGLYDPEDSFGSYCDDLIYANSPNLFLANMSADHPYIDLYNQRKMVFCVGQGAWEDVLKASTGWLKHVLEQKGIHATVDFWGHDVNHDWPWWLIQFPYHVDKLLGC